MKIKNLLSVAAACAALFASGAPEKIIFDTDMYTDFDDVGALATLHALADAGECEILGTVACTRGAPSVGMVEIINAYYGRPDIPLGVTEGTRVEDGAVRVVDVHLFVDFASLRYVILAENPDRETIEQMSR